MPLTGEGEVLIHELRHLTEVPPSIDKNERERIKVEGKVLTPLRRTR